LLDRLHKTVKEAEQLLHSLNEDGPILLREATEAVQNVNRIARDLGEGIGATKQDVDSMSTLGRTIKRVYGLVQFGADVMRIVCSVILADSRKDTTNVLLPPRGRWAKRTNSLS